MENRAIAVPLLGVATMVTFFGLPHVVFLQGGVVA